MEFISSADRKWSEVEIWNNFLFWSPILMISSTTINYSLNRRYLFSSQSKSVSLVNLLGQSIPFVWEEKKRIMLTYAYKPLEKFWSLLAGDFEKFELWCIKCSLELRNIRSPIHLSIGILILHSLIRGPSATQAAWARACKFFPTGIDAWKNGWMWLRSIMIAWNFTFQSQ